MTPFAENSSAMPGLPWFLCASFVLGLRMQGLLPGAGGPDNSSF